RRVQPIDTLRSTQSQSLSLEPRKRAWCPFASLQDLRARSPVSATMAPLLRNALGEVGIKWVNGFNLRRRRRHGYADGSCGIDARGTFRRRLLPRLRTRSFRHLTTPKICSGPRDAWRVSDDSAAKKKDPWFGRLQLPGSFCYFSVCR